jgi:hypothetical protein
MNWADQNSVNSGKPYDNDEGNPEPRQRSMREGAETRHGASVTLQQCKACDKPKDPSDFYKKDKEGLRTDTTCKACRIIAKRERTLGVTEDDYWRMYYEQEGKCGICHRRLYSKRYKAFCVDHNHSTDAIRGLLCHNCNRALGMFRDTVEVLERAILWLQNDGIVRSSR